jgi:hypothetical protein
MTSLHLLTMTLWNSPQSIKNLTGIYAHTLAFGKDLPKLSTSYFLRPKLRKLRR